MLDFNFYTLSEARDLTRDQYVDGSCRAMESRFTNFVVAPEQQRAWKVGFGWMHDLFEQLDSSANKWICLPEYAAPLVSGRPDFVLVTASCVVVIEMKTGALTSEKAGSKQVLDYSTKLWGKLKAARTRAVIPVLLSARGKKTALMQGTDLFIHARPREILNLNPSSLVEFMQQVIYREQGKEIDFLRAKGELIYSPRPSVIEAAISLVAATEDKNVITGLSSEVELERIARIIQEKATQASLLGSRELIVIAGPPGAGKTLVGLRLAHDPEIQKLLPSDSGTPLYLTGNGPLVDVLVESLARDEVRRRGTLKSVAISNADSKVRLIHGVTEKKLGIESNVIVFDEGQRIWTQEHMRRKKGDSTLSSEAEEVMSYLEQKDWALVVVLLGEGQEINTGEAGVITWLEAVRNRNNINLKKWKITAPPLEIDPPEKINIEINPALRLQVVRRTDNSADVSSWVQEILKSDFSAAIKLRSSFLDYPLFITRDLEQAKNWLRTQVEKYGGTSGLLASSKSKRLFKYGLDATADANRSFSWQNWYLNTLPDLNSSEALEVVATEYKSQGLELDWVGVCWSWDLVLHDSAWTPRTLSASNAKWRRTLSKSQYQINAYRVLLTRSRRGMVIWIPIGVPGDKSMKPAEMNQIYDALLKSGANQI